MTLGKRSPSTACRQSWQTRTVCNGRDCGLPSCACRLDALADMQRANANGQRNQPEQPQHVVLALAVFGERQNDAEGYEHGAAEGADGQDAGQGDGEVFGHGQIVSLLFGACESTVKNFRKSGHVSSHALRVTEETCANAAISKEVPGGRC